MPPRKKSTLPDLRVLPITVHAQTADKLREAIMSGALEPGERLIEADLCARIGVSRTSVREALRRLEGERLINITPNRGPSVAEITWEIARQIYDVRALLEGEAAALFATNASDIGLAELRAALEDFEAASSAGNALERLKTTERFYKAILDGCGNSIIAELLTGLVARITFLRARSMSQAGRPRHSAAEMRKIFEAIEAGDAAEARAAAIKHVRAACAVARQVFGANTAEGSKPKRQRRRAS